MAHLRSLIFWILLYITVIILIILYFPLAIFFRSSIFADHCAALWSKSVLWLLRVILGVDHQIINIQAIPKTPCIIACQHQSMWETIIFHLICRYPSYIYKKELLKIPFYGWYVRRMSGIKVDRKGGASALKDMIKQAKSLLEKGHNIIIFPQGTRVPYGDDKGNYPYQIGITALYMATEAPVVPAVLNSGKFWGKSFLIKKSGTITIKFLEPINPGLSKKDFITKLEHVIDSQKL